MGTLTKEEAIDIYDRGLMSSLLSKQEIAVLQLGQSLLCCDFNLFRESVEFALARPVFTHEFAYFDNLRAELAGLKNVPTSQQILDQIPAEKRIVIEIPE